MSQFPHDDFIKEYLPELVKDYGVAYSGKKITSQTKEIDVLFEPKAEEKTNIKSIGLLGKFLTTTCLFEVYRNPVTINQINECLSKLTDWKTSLKRKLKKNQSTKKLDKKTVRLWILTPTLSDKILNSFQVEIKPDWLEGIYFLPQSLSTGIVVIHRLPATSETLWLRILGKGKVQENALKELRGLPKENPYRERVLDLVSNLFTMLELNRQQGLSIEDQELIMKLSPVYEARLEETKKLGIEQGIQENIIRQLKKKFGGLPKNLELRVRNLSVNVLEDLSEALLDFNSQADLINWFNNH